MLMPQANWIILLHFLALWGSVITGLASRWRVPVPFAVSIPVGTMIWLVGFLYNLNALRDQRADNASHRAALQRHTYRRIGRASCRERV